MMPRLETQMPALLLSSLFHSNQTPRAWGLYVQSEQLLAGDTSNMWLRVVPGSFRHQSTGPREFAPKSPESRIERRPVQSHSV